jgi:hypothetical protein
MSTASGWLLAIHFILTKHKMYVVSSGTFHKHPSVYGYAISQLCNLTLQALHKYVQLV